MTRVVSLCMLIALSGCAPIEPQDHFAEYEAREIGEALIDVPVGMWHVENDRWFYNRDKKVAIAWFSDPQPIRGELHDMLADMVSTNFDPPVSEYELVGADTLWSGTSGIIGLLQMYRKNEIERKSNPVKVYTYHSVAVVRMNDMVYRLRGRSIGLNFNPSMQRIFSSIRPFEQT